jgi:hypothetical protein
MYGEGRGWIYYRNASGSWGAVGGALEEVQAMYDPGKRHMIVARQDVEVEEEEDDDGDRPPRPRAARVIATGLAAAATVTALSAQPPARRAMPITAARMYSGFLHNQHVAIVGTVAVQGLQQSLVDREGALRLVMAGARAGDHIEARGILLDLGRMRRDDPRLASLGLLPLLKAAYNDRWPRPGEDIALAVTSTAEPAASLEQGPPLRSVALEPTRFEGEVVTVVGEFRGRNLFADLPEAPTTTGGWDFVLRYADAAIWVTGVQPKGRDFVLDPTQRRDTGRWFRVSGVVRTRFGVTWLEAKDFAPAAALAVPTGFIDSVTTMPSSAQPIEVLFVSPVKDDADVRLDTPVRVQFSRDLDAASLADRIRVGYAEADSADRGEPPPAALFTTRYDPATRSLEIRPSPAWARLRQVTVSFLEGIRGTDGAPVAAFSVTFTTGG